MLHQDKANEISAWLPEVLAKGVLKLAAFGLTRRSREKFLDGRGGWERSRAALRAQDPSPLIDCWASLTAADYRDVLGHIDVPAMLVYGGESNFYGVETANYVARQIPNSILHIYEGSDHWPHQWQRERFSRELMAFIAQAA